VLKTVSFVNQKKAPFFAFSSIVIVTQKTYEFKKNERRFDLPSLIEKGFFQCNAPWHIVEYFT
jgi:hypothetical protein